MAYIGFAPQTARPGLIFAGMMTAAIHIPARYYRPEPVRDYAAPFERWLGYRLHPAIRHVFTHLEHQRAKRRHQRLFIRANPKIDTMLRTALADYLRWRLDVTDPLETCVVFARDRKGLAQFSHPKSLLYTSFNPEGPRGLTFRMALVLDADTYPDRGRHFDRVWRTVASPMDFSHHSLLIVHGTPRPRMRVNTFTIRHKALLRDHSLPLIDLTLPPNHPTGGSTVDYSVVIHPVRPAKIPLRPAIRNNCTRLSNPPPTFQPLLFLNSFLT